MSGENVLMMVRSNGDGKTTQSMSHRSAIVRVLESRPCTQGEIRGLLKESFGLDLSISQIWHTIAGLQKKSLRGKTVECKKTGKYKYYHLVDQSENDQPTIDGENLDQVIVSDSSQPTVESDVIQNDDTPVEPAVSQEIKLSLEEETNMADGFGLDWYSLISDLNRTGQGETLVGDQRRAILLGEYYARGLSLNRLASSIDKPVKDVKSYLRYYRFISSTDKTITSNISKQIFHEYWLQVVDPQDMKNRSKLSVVDEQGYFKFIERLVGKGEAPIKVTKKLAPPDVSTLKTVKQIRIELRRRYKEDIKTQLDWLKSLLGTDRSLYSPNGIAAAAYKLDEAFKGLEQFLAEIGVVKEA
jgi:hypothetical protein